MARSKKRYIIKRGQTLMVVQKVTIESKTPSKYITGKGNWVYWHKDGAKITKWIPKGSLYKKYKKAHKLMWGIELEGLYGKKH